MANESTYGNSSVDAAILRGQKQEAIAEQNNVNNELWAEDFDGDLDNESFDEESVDSKIKADKNKKRVSIKKAKFIRSVKRKIRKERFDGLLFFSTLILALIKDSLDVFTLGVFGPAIAFVINPLLSIFLWIGGSSKIESKLKRIVIVNLIETIPLLSIFPVWVMVIIKIKMEQDNKVRRLERILRRLER